MMKKMISNHFMQGNVYILSVTDTIYELLYFTYAYISSLNNRNNRHILTLHQNN